MSVHYRILFIIILNIIIVTSDNFKCEKKDSEEKPKTTQMRIKEHILCDYDKTVRPVVGKSSTKIQLHLVVKKAGFSEFGAYGELEGTFVVVWLDEHLTWEPKDFDNVRRIKVDSSEIWVPDLSVFNKGPYDSKEVIDSSTKCNIFYTKKVICIYSSSITGMCVPNLRHWPYDVQNCTIKLGSWYHAGSEINLAKPTAIIDSSHFEKSPEWILKHLDAKVDPGVYKSFPNETFPSIKVNFVIGRQTGSISVCIMLPFFTLISLTLLPLFLDPRTSERIYLCILNIPCHMMTLFNYMWETPEYGTIIPYILLYLRNSGLLASLILIETMVIRFLFEKRDAVPVWLITVLSKVSNNFAGRVLLYKEIASNKDENVTTDEGTLVEIEEKPSEWFLLGRIIDTLFLIIAIILYVISFLICIS